MSDLNLEQMTENWTPEAKAKAYQEFKLRTSGERQKWYCKNPGRNCDGKPHPGYPYPHARGSQWPPPGSMWEAWLIMSGRGWGKTRTGGEWVRAVSSKVGRIAMIGQDVASVRQTMVEGESGLRRICELAGEPYDWKPALKTFTFTRTGATVFGYSAEEPDSLRGPQFGAAWLDEPPHMPLIDAVWDNLGYGLRLPGLPGGAKAILTSTPLPIKWLKELIADDGTQITRGHTDENIANLDESYQRRIIDKQRGTRKGRQELAGELLEDTPGALWNNGMISVVFEEIDPSRRGEFERIIVSIDPAGTNNRRSDLTGIVVVGKRDGIYYVLGDRSGKYSPSGWASEADKLYKLWEADAIIAEKNYGGDMVKTTIEGSGTRARVLVKQASRSKQLRAEPAVALYERDKVRHNIGWVQSDKGPLPLLANLEEEMTTWVPGKGDSPNRVDALVWALDELAGNESAAEIASPATMGNVTPIRPEMKGFGPRPGSPIHLPLRLPRRLSR